MRVKILSTGFPSKSIMLDTAAWRAGQVNFDPNKEVSDDQSITSSRDCDGVSNLEENIEFGPLLELSESPFYDGLDEHSKEAFDRMIKKSKSRSLLPSEEYRYYCSVLKEPYDAPIDAPYFYSEKERGAFHRKRSKIRRSFHIEGDLLCFTPTSGPTKLVASHDNAFHLLALAHRPGTTHYSKTKMYPIVSANIHGLTRDDVRDFVAVCSVCGSHRGKSDLPEYSGNNQEEEPFYRLQLDFVDQYHQPSKGYSWILAIRDHLSNFCRLYPLKTKCPSDVVDCLDIFIRYFGSPKVIQHSGDHIFGCAIAHLVCLRGIDLTIGRTRSSFVESSAKEFTEKVQLKVEAWVNESGKSRWDESIEQIEMSINTDPYPTVPSLNAYKTVFGMERATILEEMTVNSPKGQPRLDVTSAKVNAQAKRPSSEISHGITPDCVSKLLSSLPHESSHDIEPSFNTDALLNRADRLAESVEQIVQHQLVAREKMAEK